MDAIGDFERSGFHRPLNYYRAIQPYYDLAGAFARATVRQPSLFAFGSEDGLVKMREPDQDGLKKTATDLRGFLRLEGAGHWPQMEATDRVNEALLGFLKRPG